ncbi:hypothetical protein J7E93_24645 [Streptomyces sp. ISL-36]|uniref:hypothetical protein n=1 Tax=Streptomyces sp. ISL-36 TaxID=2819182 RepID=UPI001BE92A0D|nr:hypothetical protein [Streptomyces sp. ISL-36]MBT2443224.1 hypothetical protein [Streptomyces sp. ISL-36]
MGDLLPLLTVVGVLGAVMGFFGWVASHVRRRGLAGTAVSAALASYDEAFRVTAHVSHYELRAQAERQVPIPSPDGPWKRGPGAGVPPVTPTGRAPRTRVRRRWWALRR